MDDHQLAHRENRGNNAGEGWKNKRKMVTERDRRRGSNERGRKRQGERARERERNAISKQEEGMMERRARMESVNRCNREQEKT